MFTFLTAEGVGHDAWRQACVEAASENWLDPHATPEWARLWAGPGERPTCLIMRDESNNLAAMVPIIVRPIPVSQGTPPGHLFDAVSPYGRGGPFVAPGTDIMSVISALEDSPLSRQLVTTYLRGPWGWLNDSTLTFELLERGNVVVRDLHADDDRLLASYKHKVRKNINRAREHGLKVVWDHQGDRWAAFISIYRETMRRVAADPWYDFEDAHFAEMGELLDTGILALFHVLDEDVVVSSELVVTGGGSRAYSFLGGTTEAGMHRRANDLLKHEIFRGLRDRRFAEFWLGGGKEPGDGIYRYKLSFAPGGAVPTWGSCLVHDDKAYAALLSQADVVAGGTFFPAYRSPQSSGG